jgi:hypothetical protein
MTDIRGFVPKSLHPPIANAARSTTVSKYRNGEILVNGIGLRFRGWLPPTRCSSRATARTIPDFVQASSAPDGSASALCLSVYG